MTTTKNTKRLTSKGFTKFLNYHGLSDAEFASIMGVSQNCVKFWRTGTRAVTLTTTRLVKLFNAYPDLLQTFAD